METAAFHFEIWKRESSINVHGYSSSRQSKKQFYLTANAMIAKKKIIINDKSIIKPLILFPNQSKSPKMDEKQEEEKKKKKQRKKLTHPNPCCL